MSSIEKIQNKLQMIGQEPGSQIQKMQEVSENLDKIISQLQFTYKNQQDAIELVQAISQVQNELRYSIAELQQFSRESKEVNKQLGK